MLLCAELVTLTHPFVGLSGYVDEVEAAGSPPCIQTPDRPEVIITPLTPFIATTLFVPYEYDGVTGPCRYPVYVPVGVLPNY